MLMLSPARMDEAAGIIREGGVVAYPTETFYGLAARFDSAQALNKIAEVKVRSRQKAALPLIISGEDMLGLVMEGEPQEAERMLMKMHWPGPLTLLLRARPGLLDAVVSSGTVAVRVPGLQMARELTRLVGVPITSTSANPTGLAPATSPRVVRQYFEREDLDAIIDAGQTPGGLPSTIVRVDQGRILIVRAGAVNIEGAASA